jgi:hypothetical protein
MHDLRLNNHALLMLQVLLDVLVGFLQIGKDAVKV